MEKTNNIIARINHVAIIVTQKEKLVPIKPICEALGIDDKSQRQKISEDEILSSTGVLSTLVAADGRGREMFCLPLEFAFGWLFSINHKNVKPEAQEAVKQYKMQCYHALYRHFTEYAEFVQDKQKELDEALEVRKVAKTDFNKTKTVLRDADDSIEKARHLNFDDWRARKSQIEMDFKEADEFEE